MDTQRGYFILADICGYTSYLADVELTHARDVLTELLELIVERFKPTLTIQELEGDAVFAYVPKTKLLRDETLLEILESTYLAFRDRVQAVVRRTTCQCNACRQLPTLDLKFVVHYGEYMTQDVSGIKKLIGSDLNLVHRLLKNHVSETTGWKAYALFTEAALTQMNIKLESLHEQVELYEHLGDIKTYSFDLHARHKELTEARRVVIAPKDADLIISRSLSASPTIVWGWMNEIEKRLAWERLDEIRPLAPPDARTGPGSRNHCAHGKDVIIETILDWRPFEYYTVANPMVIQSRYLEPRGNGTGLNVCVKLKMPMPSWLTRPLAKFMFKQFKAEEQFDTMARLIAEAVQDDQKGL